MITKDWGYITFKREYQKGPVPFYMFAVLAFILSFQITNVVTRNYAFWIAEQCNNDVANTLAENMEAYPSEWTFDQFYFTNKKRGVSIASTDVYENTSFVQSWTCRVRVRLAANPIKERSVADNNERLLDRLSEE